MPRVDAEWDGLTPRWEEGDFYKSDYVEARTRESSTPSWVAPAIAAVETLLFVAGPEGILLSAGLGFAFTMLQPPKVVQYTESTRDIVRKATTEALRNNNIVKAADLVKDFHGDLETMELFTEDIKRDDFRALDTTVLNHLFRVVQTGGALQAAFDALRDNLSFDGTNHGNHLQWLSAAVLSIFQAYWLRCTAYSQMAQYYRRRNDFHNYNVQLASVRISFEGLQKHIPDLLKQVEDRVSSMKIERLNTAKVDYDMVGTDWVMRNMGSADKENVRRVSYVQDTTSGRRHKIAYLWPGTDYTDGMGIKSDTNDNKLQEHAEYVLPKYKVALEQSMDRDAAPLLENLRKLRDLVDGFVKKCQPGSPKFAPLHVGYVHMGTPGNVPSGTHQSFRIRLLDSKGSPIGDFSPWSDWITTQSTTQLHQFLIGDGYSLTDVTRQIYVRARAPNMPVFDVEGEKGVLVDEVKGHGLLLWPEESAEGWI